MIAIKRVAENTRGYRLQIICGRCARIHMEWLHACAHRRPTDFCTDFRPLITPPTSLFADEKKGAWIARLYALFPNVVDSYIYIYIWKKRKSRQFFKQMIHFACPILHLIKCSLNFICDGWRCESFFRTERNRF